MAWGCSGETTACACVCQTDLDALCAGTSLPSSSCSPMELRRKWQEVTPKRGIPSVHRRCTSEQHRIQGSQGKAVVSQGQG